MSIENSAKEILHYVEKSREAGLLGNLLEEMLANFGDDYDAVAAAFFLAHQALFKKEDEEWGGAKLMPFSRKGRLRV